MKGLGGLPPPSWLGELPPPTPLGRAQTPGIFQGDSRSQTPDVEDHFGHPEGVQATGKLTMVLGNSEIVYLWDLDGPDRPPHPSRKVEGLALFLFVGVWTPIGPFER